MRVEKQEFGNGKFRKFLSPFKREMAGPSGDCV